MILKFQDIDGDNDALDPGECKVFAAGFSLPSGLAAQPPQLPPLAIDLGVGMGTGIEDLLVDTATRAVLSHIKTLAGQGQPFKEIVQTRFSLQTFERLPFGTGLLEPTAITGGWATLELASTQDPSLISVRLLRLVLEGPDFSFQPRIKAITGVLDLRTGAFHLTLSFRRMMTPETPQPFTWEGTAEGVYDFDTGVVSLTEKGQGAFLAK